MALTPLNILYVVLIVAVLAVGGLLAVVLWQLSLMIAQARSIFIPQVQAILKEAERNLENVDHITLDVNQKLHKLDQAVDAANNAVQSIGKTTMMINQTVAQPAVASAAATVAGIKAAWGYMADRRFKSRRERALERAEQPVSRPAMLTRE